MGRGSAEADSTTQVATRGNARKVDPVVAETIAILKGDSFDRDRRARLVRRGLMIETSSGLGFQVSTRTVPSVLGKVMLEKGRVPTPTEVRRASKQIDADLKKIGVRGDVTSGSYAYPQLRGAAEERMYRLIAEREKIDAFERARDDGAFQAIRLTNKQSRVARDRLVSLLEEKLAGPYVSKHLPAQIDRLRSGVVSLEEAYDLVRSVGTSRPMTDRVGRGEDVSADDHLVSVEAISIGLGLPSTRSRVIEEQEKSAARLRSILDRVGTGETVYGDEIEWSSRGVHDARVKRAAFGYCDAAARIQADYHQGAIIELKDGSVAEMTVKRVHSDLENYVDDVVEQASWEAGRLKEAEDLGEKAEKKLRSWARSA